MKKLIYNYNTNEMIFVEEESGKRNGIRECLERNKIFVEVFSLIFVGVMGIVISFVGWRTDKRSSDIYQKQLEILQNDREPYFTIKCETVYSDYQDDGYYMQKKYTIKNEGGRISEAFIKYANSYLIIDIPINKKNNYKNLHFIYEIENRFSTPSNECFYNEKTKELVFYGVDNSDYEDFSMKLEQELNRILKRDDIYVLNQNYVELYYVNYKNEEFRKKYEFTQNTIVINETNDEVFIRVGQSNDIALIVEEIYEYIEEWDHLLDY